MTRHYLLTPACGNVLTVHRVGGLVGGDVAGLHLFDLFYQVCLLVVELVVLGAIVVETRQKLDQLLPIAEQDLLDWPRLVRVRDEHLNHTHTLLWPPYVMGGIIFFAL